MATSHKFLVTAKFIPPKKYKKFLSKYETVTGLPTKFEIEIKNIGKNEFPGGRFVNRKLTFETSHGTVTIATSGVMAPNNIPSLGPGDVCVIQGSHIFRIPGPWRYVVDMKAKDNAEIEFYQTPKGIPSKEAYNIVYAVDRHQLDLASLLEKSLKKR